MILGKYMKPEGSSEELYYCGNDHLGSCRVVYEDDGDVSDMFSYSIWGEKSHDIGSNEDFASFTGKEYDATGLLYFNARYYDPEVGRFITEDTSRKGTSWYTYCENNPLTFTDPTGRQSTERENKSGLREIWQRFKENVREVFRRSESSEQGTRKTTQETAAGLLPGQPSYEFSGPQGELVITGALPSTTITPDEIVARAESQIGKAYGHYGEGYTAFVPADASLFDCTQLTGYASNKPTTGSGEYPGSSNYMRVDVGLRGDTKVWRATSPEGERVGHAAILTGMPGERALIHSEHGKGVQYSADDILDYYQAKGFTDIVVEYYRPR